MKIGFVLRWAAVAVCCGWAGVSPATEIAWSITLDADVSAYKNVTVALICGWDPDVTPQVSKATGSWEVSTGYVYGVANFTAASGTKDFTQGTSEIVLNVDLEDLCGDWEENGTSGWTDPRAGYFGYINVVNADRWSGISTRVFAPSDPSAEGSPLGTDGSKMYLAVFDASKIENATNAYLIDWDFNTAANWADFYDRDIELLTVHFRLPAPPVPEPASTVLFALGAALCALRRREGQR